MQNSQIAVVYLIKLLQVENHRILLQMHNPIVSESAGRK